VRKINEISSATDKYGLSIMTGAFASPYRMPGEAWLAGKFSPKGTAKQILFELSQFVLSCKMYVTRHQGKRI
jgi:hypothetical protein